jgi:protein SCO1
MTRKTSIVLVGAIALLLLGGIALSRLLPEPTLQTARSIQTGAIGGPFALTAADGHTVTDQTYRRKWMLIYFGYTSCPDACPTALNNIGVALDRLGGNAAAFQPLFITVDPKRDTREELSQYMKSFDPRIVALTGSSGQIAAVEKEFHVYVKAHDEKGGDGFIDHSSLIYLINPQGKFVVDMLAGDLSGDAIADRLRQLVAGPA